MVNLRLSQVTMWAAMRVDQCEKNWFRHQEAGVPVPASSPIHHVDLGEAHPVHGPLFVQVENSLVE